MISIPCLRPSAKNNLSARSPGIPKTCDTPILRRYATKKSPSAICLFTPLRLLNLGYCNKNDPTGRHLRPRGVLEYDADGEDDVLEDTSHAIPGADATQPARNVSAAVRPSLLSAVDRRPRPDVGESGSVDGRVAHADAARPRARHDPDCRRARLAGHRLSHAQSVHLALPARRGAGTRRPNRAWRIAHHADAAP